MKLVHGKRYKISTPGAKGVGTYTGRFYNKMIRRWVYTFNVSLGRTFAVTKDAIKSEVA